MNYNYEFKIGVPRQLLGTAICELWSAITLFTFLKAGQTCCCPELNLDRQLAELAGYLNRPDNCKQAPLASPVPAERLKTTIS